MFLFSQAQLKPVLGPMGVHFQECNSLGVIEIVAEIRLRQARNIIFTTVVVPLLTIQY